MLEIVVKCVVLRELRVTVGLGEMPVVNTSRRTCPGPSVFYQSHGTKTMQRKYPVGESDEDEGPVVVVVVE